MDDLNNRRCWVDRSIDPVEAAKEATEIVRRIMCAINEDPSRFDLPKNGSVFITSTQIAEIIRPICWGPLSVNAASRRIKRHIENGHIKTMAFFFSGRARGFIVQIQATTGRSTSPIPPA